MLRRIGLYGAVRILLALALFAPGSAKLDAAAPPAPAPSGEAPEDEKQVAALLFPRVDTMRTDPNPLFRDKAACALAHDQIHLTDAQKVHLYGRLIQALRDQEPQVRAIASQALQIQTGQSKGYRPDAPPEEREASIRLWERWLQEYRSNL